MAEELKYTIVESDRARRLRIAVYAGGRVVVTKPRLLDADMMRKFVELKRPWVESKLSMQQEAGNLDLADSSYKHFLFNRGPARELVRDKLEQWNGVYNFEYRRFIIKQMKSRWGSCSSDGNLSFNYKLLFLPEEAQNYVVVHELCHLREMNHSARFWDLVALSIPNHKEIKKSL